MVGPLEQKFVDVADGDPARTSSLRRAFYLGMALKSAEARRSKAL